MAYLSKEQYAYRRESAARRMAANKDNCDTLTEEQHDALAYVCQARHELHDKYRAAYFTEYGDHDKWWGGVLDNPFTGEMGAINQALVDAGLPAIEGLSMPEDLPNDCYREYMTVAEALEEAGIEYPEDLFDEDGDVDYSHEEANRVMNELLYYHLSQVADAAEKINAKIERYLRGIDEEHGTNYEPTGALRV
jgi:hypothetical protein